MRKNIFVKIRIKEIEKIIKKISKMKVIIINSIIFAMIWEIHEKFIMNLLSFGIQGSDK